MRGLEYLTADRLGVFWRQLRELVVDQAKDHAGGPAAWLASVNPVWHLLGRVTFHLAENKRDPGRPFAFLATYTTGRFHLSHGLFGPTEIRILLAVGNILILNYPYVNLAGRRFLSFDFGGAVAIVGMTAMVLFAAFRQTVLLYKKEALP